MSEVAYALGFEHPLHFSSIRRDHHVAIATKTQQFKSSLAPAAKKAVKASRKTRTAAAAETAKDLPPTTSVKGSERARQMKSSTPESRHGRRSG